ncbi:CHAT domain-containing protein [Candidatus Sumerlaeota bacterium]|nr:CHAT domain-containing protein [Candidatus Sumerlaeota bacterium]
MSITARILVLATLFAALASVSAFAATTYANPQAAITAADNQVAQAQAIENALQQGNWQLLQSQGLTTREAALQQAMNIRRQAVSIYQEYGDLEDASIQLSELASTARSLGMLDLALQDLRAAAEIDLGMGRGDWILIDLRDLAGLFEARGHTVERVLALREIARLAERRGQRQEAVDALCELAQIGGDLGNWAGAEEDAAHAVDLARPLSRPATLARCLHLLGRAQRVRGLNEEARRSLDEALGVAPGDSTRGDALSELARLARDEGDLTTSIARWREVIAIDERGADPSYLRQSWEGFIDVLLEAGQASEAVSVSQRRLNATRQQVQGGNAQWRTLLGRDLVDHGRALLASGDPNGARSILNEGLSLFQQMNNQTGQAEARLELAEANLALGQTDAALSDLSAIGVGHSDPEIALRAALLTAQAYRQSRRYNDAHQRLESGISQCESTGDMEGEVRLLEAMVDLWREGNSPPSLSLALSRLGAALVHLGRDVEARPIYEELMGVYAATGDLTAWSIDLTNFAQLCERLGDLDQAIALVEQATGIDTQRSDTRFQAIDYADLARLRAASGDLPGAVEAARQIVLLGDQMSDSSYQIQGRERMAQYQIQAGDHGAAAATLAEADQLAVAAGDLHARSRILSAFAELAMRGEDWAEAERQALMALTVDQQLNNSEFQALDRVHMCIATARQNRTADAIEHASEAIRLASHPSDEMRIAATVNRAFLRIRAGQGDQGVSELQQILPLLRDLGMETLAVASLKAMADYQRDQGQADLAIDTLAEAIALAEGTIGDQPLSSILYIPEPVPLNALYDEIVSLLASQDRVVEALQYSVRQDGRALSEQTLEIALADNPEMLERAAEEAPETPEGTRGETPATPVETPREEPDLLATPTEEGPEPSVVDWANILAQMDENQRGAFEIGEFDLPFILEALPDDQTLFVIYHLGSDGESSCRAFFGALDLQPGMTELPATRDQVVEHIAEFRRLVRESNDALEEVAQGRMSQADYDVIARRLEGQADAALVTLYSELVQPLERAVPDYRDFNTVLIYPTGVMRLLPFGALIRERPDGRREHWVESRDIVYFPAVTSQLAQRHMAEPVRRILGKMLAVAYPGSRSDGNYIANVIEEEAAIREIWTERRGADHYRSLPNEEATRENLLVALRDGADILHIATHGTLRIGQSGDSYISLANRERLVMEDLRALPLRGTRLTVLSMCNAEYNPDGPADALGTFARSIYLAGCPSVVASLWRVRDESALALMREFYRNLVTGEMSRVRALSEAQRAMIATRGQEHDYSHPFHWAPFVLIGEWR